MNGLTEAKAFVEWPGKEFLKKWIVATDTKLAEKADQYKGIKLVLQTNFLSLSKLVCKICSGFCHIPDDYQNKK